MTDLRDDLGLVRNVVLTKPRMGVLHLDGWAGRTRVTVEVIGETPKRYRIRAIKRTKLAGRNRWINPGESALVPKLGITFDEGV